MEVKSAQKRTRAKCPYCQEQVWAGYPGVRSCPQCQAVMHTECWQELGSCGACGHKYDPDEIAEVANSSSKRYLQDVDLFLESEFLAQTMDELITGNADQRTIHRELLHANDLLREKKYFRAVLSLRSIRNNAIFQSVQPENEDLVLVYLTYVHLAFEGLGSSGIFTSVWPKPIEVVKLTERKRRAFLWISVVLYVVVMILGLIFGSERSQDPLAFLTFSLVLLSVFLQQQTFSAEYHVPLAGNRPDAVFRCFGNEGELRHFADSPLLKWLKIYRIDENGEVAYFSD